jgi:tRNA(Ile)-lysidine synthase
MEEPSPGGQVPPALATEPATDPAAGQLGDMAAALLARCHFPPIGPSGRSDEPLPLAVSGGADSLALLILAAAANRRVLVFHVDHGLRPDSDSEAATVAAAAARFGAGFECRTVTVAPGPNLEARARAARYRALPAGVLTGHTMDDQAETVLLALLRGAGLDGLSGMRTGLPPDGSPPGAGSDPTHLSGWPADGSPLQAGGTGRPIRPLLGLRRHETAALCASAGLRPLVDSTNSDPRFRRNRVRAELLPLLSVVAGRDVVPILARQAGLLGEDARYLESLAAALEPTDARALAAAPAPLARRAVRRWLRAPDSGADHECHPPSAAEVGRVLAVAAGTARACELAGGRRVERRAGRLNVTPGKVGAS